jgi:gamma-glutamyltranspeptidase/glutathione hydrolase
MRTICLALILAAGWSGFCCADEVASESFDHAIVAADHPLASEAGLGILQQGGNVVDAAVATAFALSVLRPEGCGIGGGGFMLIYDASTGETVAIDYREQAPAAAFRDMFLDADGEPIEDLSRHGGLAVATPCEIKGLCLALEEYGTLDLPTVLAPAMRLAREGVPLDEAHCEAQQLVIDDITSDAARREKFAVLERHYLNGGAANQAGDRFYSPLIDVFERLSRDGSSGFYEGEVADAIVDAVEDAGGVLTHDDLASVQPVIRAPLEHPYQGANLLAMPPPSSGGVALIEMLNIVSAYERSHSDVDLHDLEHNSPEYVHLLAEVMQHAFADRAAFLGDADFAEVPIERLLSAEHAADLASRIDDAAHPPDYYGRFAPLDDAGTSHFSIIDAEGNAVACTATINTLYGSYVVVPEFGIVLNNEMDDFAALPGRPNAFRLVQSEANAIAPGKRPLSSMTPTILVRDGRAVFAAGASGGPRIITSTFQVLLNVTRFEMSVQDAVAAPRFHHQWLPAHIEVEPSLLDPLQGPLAGRGHELIERDALGNCQAVLRLPDGRLQGMSDPRKGGEARGY